jgi:hypothetical protein
LISHFSQLCRPDQLCLPDQHKASINAGAFR